MVSPLSVRRYECTAKDWFVNVFLVETPEGVVLIDAGMARSSSRDVRRIIDEELERPLLAVLLTHGHPDHYVGLAEIVGERELPILSTRGAFEQMKERDANEAPVLAQFFGDDFPARRVFSNTFVKDGDVVTFGGVRFRLLELGHAESESDSIWSIDDGKHLFVGDLLYYHMHAFFMDGHAEDWLRQLERVQALCDHQTKLYPGHGEICGMEALWWQAGYIGAFLGMMRSLLGEGEAGLSPEKQAVLVERMKAYVQNEKLLYLLTFGMDVTVRLLRERRAL